MLPKHAGRGANALECVLGAQPACSAAPRTTKCATPFCPKTQGILDFGCFPPKRTPRAKMNPPPLPVSPSEARQFVQNTAELAAHPAGERNPPYSGERSFANPATSEGKHKTHERAHTTCPYPPRKTKARSSYKYKCDHKNTHALH